MHYARRLHELFESAERAFFQRLSAPAKIQDYLDTLPINYELKGETYLSPRLVLRHKKAHCFEGALLAAAALAYHGQQPLLLDLQTRFGDQDHVVALFRLHGLWGAISKTNHSVLRYRDAVYRTPRELAMSYFSEYSLPTGKKTMRAYSAPFDLTRFAPEKWVTTEEHLQWLVNAVDRSRHFPVAPHKNMRSLRKTDAIEIRSQELVEWRRDGTKNRYRYR